MSHGSVPDADVSTAIGVLERNWRPEGGYTSPNRETYPWLWLWDSCFHALIWAAVGDGRAAVELSSALAAQRPNGFVPHMSYALATEAARELWGVDGASTITQPPMYAHAALQLAQRGAPLPDGLVRRIEAGLEHLWTRRRASNGLLSCVHPWEAADDSPRWDSWTSTPFDRFGAWKRRKRELVDALELDADDLLERLHGADSLTLSYRDQRGRDHTVTGMVVAVTDEAIIVLPFGGERPREVLLDGIEWFEVFDGDGAASPSRPRTRR